MTLQEIVDEVNQLSLKDQLALLETLTRTILESQHIRGLLATDQPEPSDEDVKTSYTDYLDEKYR